MTTRYGKARKSRLRPTVKTVNTKVNRLARKVEASDGDKYLIISNGATQLSWTGSVVDMFVPVQGDGYNQRDGDEILAKMCDLRWQLTLGTSLVASTARIIIYWDKMNTCPNPSSILASVGSADAVISRYNQEYRQNWTLLFDKTYIIDNVNKASYIVKFRKALNKKIVFNTAGTTARKGQLKVLYISNKAAGVDAPLFIQQSQVHFAG